MFVIEEQSNGLFALACIGGESGKYLSHAFEEVSLQDGIQGDGERWMLEDVGNGRVALGCVGGEFGKYLSHAFEKVSLQDSIQGDGEKWIKHSS